MHQFDPNSTVAFTLRHFKYLLSIVRYLIRNITCSTMISVILSDMAVIDVCVYECIHIWLSKFYLSKYPHFYIWLISFSTFAGKRQQGKYLFVAWCKSKTNLKNLLAVETCFIPDTILLLWNYIQFPGCDHGSSFQWS